MIKLAIILADNVESSIRIISESIVRNLPNIYSADIFSIKNNCKNSTNHIKPIFSNFWKLKDYDIIHLQAAMPISLAPIIRLLFRKVKIISTEHDHGWKYFKHTLPLFKSLILRQSLFVGRISCHINTYPSYSLFRDVYGEIETNNWRAVVYNGIQDFTLSQKNAHAEHIDELAMRVVVVGNYYYSKGIDLVMSIVNDTPDIEYHLFGNIFGGLSKQKRLNLQKKMKKNVITYGMVERKVFTKFLTDNKCVVCIPSRTEVCSLVAIESLVSSHPMVVSDIPVFRELIDEDVAIFFDLDVIESLKSSMRLAFVNYNRLSVEARKLFLEKYTVEKMSKQYENHYRQMLL